MSATATAPARRREDSRPPLLPNWVAKVVMAVTGLVFTGFVFVHMVGNLKVYEGAEGFDSYARWLREVGYPLVPHYGVLWFLRIVLVVCLVAHVGVAILLAVRARRARGPHRARTRRTRMSFGARTMLLTGLVLLVFVVVHLLDLTTGTPPVAPDGYEYGSAHANLVASLGRPLMGGFYAVTMLLLAVHVLHGVVVAAGDLGATGRRTRAAATWVAGLVAVAVLVGNVSIPIAIWTGLLS